MITQREELIAISKAQRSIDPPYPSASRSVFVLPAFGVWEEMHATFNLTRQERARRVAALAFFYLTGNDVSLPPYKGAASRILRALLTEHLVRTGDKEGNLSKKAIRAIKTAQLFQTSLRVNKYNFQTMNAYSYEEAVANAVTMRRKYHTRYEPRIFALDSRGERVKCNDAIAEVAGIIKKGAH